MVGLTLGVFWRAKSKEGGSREKELGWCFDGQTWWWLAQARASNSQSFDQRTIRHERCVEINFHLNLIFKLRSLQTVRRFLKFVLAIFPAKSCVQFRSYRSAVIVVERSGCGRAERVPPHRADVGEPNANDSEARRGAGYLTRYHK